MWLSRFPTSFLCFRICLCVHIWVWMWVECLLLSLSAYSFEAWSLPEPGAYMFMVKLGAISPQNLLVPVFLGVGILGSLHGCWGPNSNPPHGRTSPLNCWAIFALHQPCAILLPRRKESASLHCAEHLPTCLLSLDSYFAIANYKSLAIWKIGKFL